MLKFFRKIRQNLLSENKLTKYLLYAIGEIALVMLGILLALQVNNWNENRKSKKTETYVLNEILSNLNEDDAILNEIINQRQITKASEAHMLGYLQKENI